MIRRALPLAMLLTTAACPPTPEHDCGVFDAGASIEIGQPDPGVSTVFHPLEDGSIVTMTAGSQGGRHVWLSLRGRDLCPDSPRVTIRWLRARDGKVVGLNNTLGGWAPVDSGAYVSQRIAAQFYESDYCAILNGESVTADVRVDDGAGHIATAQITLRVQGWSADSSPLTLPSEQACCADYTNRTCWPEGAPDAGGADASGVDASGD